MEATVASSAKTPPIPKPPPNGKRRPNYGQLHSRPLPLTTYPLPAFHPTNPASLLRLAYVFLSQLVFPPSSHPSALYEGYFSAETRSVHMTNPQHIRALWEMGFFGKGTLSRSEPSWMQREITRKKARRQGVKTAEENTIARREERRQFKLERARLEREKIERQRMIEQGLIGAEEPSANEVENTGTNAAAPLAALDETPSEQDPKIDHTTTRSSHNNVRFTHQPVDEEVEDLDIQDQEHLQLTLEEAFFLSYGLGVLDISPSTTSASPIRPQPLSAPALFQLFAAHSHFPPHATQPTSRPPSPDDPFLLHYVTYHHFRSLGWVVRPGTKFAVDYLLYLRGPVFSHAEFAVLIVPAYEDPWWETDAGRARRTMGGGAGKNRTEMDWWRLHCVNRVQSAVLKTLVLVYVDVPPPVLGVGEDGQEEEMWDGDVGGMLRRYKVREFIVRRWVANRMRD